VAGDPPEVVSGPASAQVETGSEIRLAVPIVAPLGAQYACFLDGRDITPFVSFGDGHRELFIKSAQPWHSGQLTVTVSNSGGTVTAPVADVQVSGPPGLSSAHLLNVSTRSRTGLGDETVIAGFVLEGSGSKQLLIRGVASGLESFVPGRAGRDARLTVFRGDEPLASNNDWIRLSGVAAVVDAQERAGAFALDPRSDDAALLFDAPPGAYTVHLATDPSQPGIGLVEVYDLDPGFAPCRLVNLSSRVYVGNGDLVAIPGFVVAGNSPRTYLIRAVGPGLTSHGVSGVVSDPRLQVHDINLGSFLQNDDWWDQIDPAAVAAATSSAGAFELDAGSKDAAVLATLAPGAYTVVVSGAGATTGVALVEVYEVPAEESPGASP
jgi:hypothetical protein